MKTTLLVKLDPEMRQFIHEQKELSDPSALVNKLFHDEIKRRGVIVNPQLKAEMEKDPVAQQLEMLADENTPAAG